MSDKQEVEQPKKSAAEEKEDAEQRKLEAQALDKKIESSAASHNKRSMEIGWYGSEAKRKNIFGILGHKSEEDYRVAKMIGRSTWYDMIGLAEKFEAISMKLFLTMKAVNAKLLAKQPKEVRFDEKFIEKAGILSAKKFEKYLIDKGIIQKEEEEVDDGTDISKVHEMPVTFKMQMFQNRLNSIMDGIRQFAAQHQITDESQALELIVVEVSGSKHYASIFTDSLPKLKAVLQEDGGSVEEYGARMRRALEDHIVAISEVLSRKGVKLQKAS
jgi:hypothetical protein